MNLYLYHIYITGCEARIIDVAILDYCAMVFSGWVCIVITIIDMYIIIGAVIRHELYELYRYEYQYLYFQFALLYQIANFCGIRAVYRELQEKCGIAECQVILIKFSARFPKLHEYVRLNWITLWYSIIMV